MTEIKNIAIIGGGPCGLVALNEFLHTANDGSSTIKNPGSNHPLPTNPAFPKVTVFERNPDIGGVWYYSNSPDIEFPQGVDQYSEPQNITGRNHIPDFKGNYTEPYVKSASLPSWKSSALYDCLFTNVPIHCMTFSSGSDVGYKNVGPEKNQYYPFVNHHQVEDYLQAYASANHLRKFIHFNTTVEKVSKEADKWIVTVSQRIGDKIEWHTETFDAVLVINGKSNVPYIPEIKGLAEYARKGTIMHSKSFRDFDSLKGKSVLLVGSSISSVDLLQYLIPLCSDVGISINSDDPNALSKGIYKWIDDILQDKKLPVNRYAKISEFKGDDVIFTDNTKGHFDKIIFATGYHLYCPFLDFPENKWLSGLYFKDASIKGPIHQVPNTYLWTFKLEDPTLAFLGVPPTGYFFTEAEANAAGVAGIWSGAHSLPKREEQQDWISHQKTRKSSRIIDEIDGEPFIRYMNVIKPKNRYDVLEFVSMKRLKESKKVLKRLFYQFANGLDRE